MREWVVGTRGGEGRGGGGGGERGSGGGERGEGKGGGGGGEGVRGEGGGRWPGRENASSSLLPIASPPRRGLESAMGCMSEELGIAVGRAWEELGGGGDA